MKIHPETKLESWILERGIRTLAVELGITPATVYRWLRGGSPEDRFKLRLCEMSGLTIQDVFDHVRYFQGQEKAN